MSCGEPHETDCSEVLDHLYEFLDREMSESDCTKFEVHFEECSPCLEKYGLEQAVKLKLSSSRTLKNGKVFLRYEPRAR